MNRLEIFQKVYGTDHVFTALELERLQQVTELIVRECSNIGEMKEQGYSQFDPGTSVGWYMRQHFGIKT